MPESIHHIFRNTDCAANLPLHESNRDILLQKTGSVAIPGGTNEEYSHSESCSIAVSRGSQTRKGFLMEWQDEVITQARGASVSATNRATSWLKNMYDNLVSKSLKWQMPHINVSPEKEVVFEWWSNGRKLTIYFSDENAVLIKVWGPNIDTEMNEGDAEDLAEAIDAWKWLIS